VLSVVDPSPFEVVLYGADLGEVHRLRRILRPGVAEGLLVVSLRLLPDEVERLGHHVLPTVVIDAPVESLPSVVVDDVLGGRLAARHLVELGHRRIAYIGDAVDPKFGQTSSTRRQRGLQTELAAAGIELRPEHVAQGPHGKAAAVRLATDLLSRRWPPTAIFAHSDTQAIGVLEAAENLGRRVPDELSVVGFDDIELARYVGLTTVRQPLFESGRLGASMLLDRLTGVPADAAPHHELPLELVVRQTTGPVATTSSRASSSRRQATTPPVRTTGRASQQGGTR